MKKNKPNKTLGIIFGLKFSAIALHLAILFKWLKSKINLLTFDINHGIKKIKRILLWLHFKPKHVEKGRERRKTKIIVPFRSYPTRNRNL